MSFLSPGGGSSTLLREGRLEGPSWREMAQENQARIIQELRQSEVWGPMRVVRVSSPHWAVTWNGMEFAAVRSEDSTGWVMEIRSGVINELNREPISLGKKGRSILLGLGVTGDGDDRHWLSKDGAPDPKLGKVVTIEPHSPGFVIEWDKKVYGVRKSAWRGLAMDVHDGVIHAISQTTILLGEGRTLRMSYRFLDESVIGGWTR